MLLKEWNVNKPYSELIRRICDGLIHWAIAREQEFWEKKFWKILEIFTQKHIFKNMKGWNLNGG